MPTGPPDKIVVLTVSDYRTANDFANALSSLYDQGFKFEFATGDYVALRKGYNSQS